MDNPADDLAGALSALAARRDAQLRNHPIAPARVERFLEVVAFEFPLEEALRDVATKRDRDLAQRSRKIPLEIAAALAAQVTPGYSESLPFWPRRVIQASEAIGLAAAVLLVAALLYFGTGPAGGRLRNLARATPALAPDPASVGPTVRPLFVEFGSRDHFALQVNAVDLARLHPSLLSLSHARLSDRNEARWDLRLELPVAEMLDERGAP